MRSSRWLSHLVFPVVVVVVVIGIDLPATSRLKTDYDDDNRFAIASLTTTTKPIDSIVRSDALVISEPTLSANAQHQIVGERRHDEARIRAAAQRYPR